MKKIIIKAVHKIVCFYAKFCRHSTTTTFSPTTTDSSTNGVYATVMESKSSIRGPSEDYSEMMGHLHIPTIEIPNFDDLDAFLIPADLEVSHANKFIDDYIAASTVNHSNVFSQ